MCIYVDSVNIMEDGFFGMVLMSSPFSRAGDVDPEIPTWLYGGHQ